MNFIDKSGSLVYTEAQIARRLERIERTRYSKRDEDVLNRIVSGASMGVYAPTDEEQAQIAAFNAFMAEMVALAAEVRADNTFVAQRVAYENALARLAQHKLADGRPEVYEDQPTGDLDDDGNPVMESVLVQTAVDPEPLAIDEMVYDEEGNVVDVTTVANPAIAQDEAERAAAQAVVDATPDAVKAAV
jgi:hypothetical protein